MCKRIVFQGYGILASLSNDRDSGEGTPESFNRRLLAIAVGTARTALPRLAVRPVEPPLRLDSLAIT